MTVIAKRISVFFCKGCKHSYHLSIIGQTSLFLRLRCFVVTASARAYTGHKSKELF